MTKITLHGGPKHTETLDVPVQGGEALKFTHAYTHKGVPMEREGKYTRVYTATTHQPTNDFEWVGYTAPARKSTPEA